MTSPAREASKTSPYGTFFRGRQEEKSAGWRSMLSRSDMGVYMVGLIKVYGDLRFKTRVFEVGEFGVVLRLCGGDEE